MLQPKFGDFEAKIRKLPATVKEQHIFSRRFLLAKERRLEAYYAPFHGITKTARIVIVGITPGKSQTVGAFQTARDLLAKGWPPPRFYNEIRRRVAFGGQMRSNLVSMLDSIGVAKQLDLPTSETLFSSNEHFKLVHTTSLLRYPVVLKREKYENYMGYVRWSWKIGQLFKVYSPGYGGIRDDEATEVHA